jgi:transcriptional regulator GlxA family with amidase domain
MKIVILLFDKVDLLDAGGPYEVFLTASRLLQRDGLPALFDVVTASVDGATVQAYGGLQLTPALAMSDVGNIDVLIVPGTIDIDAAVADQRLVAVIGERAQTASGQSGQVVASVCTGAFLLAEAGLLADRSWTTHWEDIELLAERADVGAAASNVRWVDTGAIVTAAGLSSGVAMALHLVDRFGGQELAQRTARQIDYPWSPEDGVTRIEAMA